MSKINILTDDEWHAWRHDGLGSSDAAAAIGHSRWKSPFRLWAEKTGRLSADIEDSRHIRRGRYLERFALQEWALATRARLLDFESYVDAVDAARLVEEHCQVFGVHDGQLCVQSRARPWQRATLDAMAFLGERLCVVEAKAPSEIALRLWGDEDEVPPDYRIQVWHALEVLGPNVQVGALAALAGNRDRFVLMERSEVPEALCALEEAFWVKHVQADVEPEFNSAVRAIDDHVAAMGELSPDDTGESLILPQEALALHAELEAARAAHSQSEKKIKELKPQLEAMVGRATYAVLPDGSGVYEYRWHSRRGYEVAPLRHKRLTLMKPKKVTK